MSQVGILLISIDLLINLAIHQSINPLIHQPIHQPTHQPINPSIHQPIYKTSLVKKKKETNAHNLPTPLIPISSTFLFFSILFFLANFFPFFHLIGVYKVHVCYVTYVYTLMQDFSFRTTRCFPVCCLDLTFFFALFQ